MAKLPRIRSASIALWLLLSSFVVAQDEPKIAEEVRVLNDANKPQMAVQASIRLENRGRSAVPALLAFVKEKGHNALTLIGTELFTRIKDERLAALCADLFADKAFFWRPMAMQALVAQESKAHRDLFRAALKDPLWGVRSYAVAGLEAIDDRDSKAEVAKLLNDAIYDVRAQAAKTLVAWGDESGLPLLVEALRSEVRWFDIDYGQLAREDAWTFLAQLVIKEKGLAAKHETALTAAFKEREGRDPTFDELAKLRKEAFTAARDEVSPGYKPWEGPKAREGGLAKWDAWMTARHPKWREQIPDNGRVRPDIAEYVFGFELRSCQRGDFFFRIDKDDNLVLGYFNLTPAKLSAEEKARFDAALKPVLALDRTIPYGRGGCDFEQYYLREDSKFSKLWIGMNGRPPELDGFIKTCRELIKTKFGEAEALEFKERTTLFRGSD